MVKQVKRVMFDTNIYGRLIEREELKLVTEKIGGSMANYGSVIIYSEEKEGAARSMRSPEALKAYEVVNELNRLGQVSFRNYGQLRVDIAKRWSS
ncbi:hypothetical protein HYY74_05100 [Candidatus Woesearchaeota archaeon]|nr:hypothetical protein [Candidatus Woesearchaeota archaeon]